MAVRIKNINEQVQSPLNKTINNNFELSMNGLTNKMYESSKINTARTPNYMSTSKYSKLEDYNQIKNKVHKFSEILKH